MNMNNRHSFINIVAEAGYISDKLLSSSNAVVFSYVLYLIAKYDYKLDAAQLILRSDVAQLQLVRS